MKFESLVGKELFGSNVDVRISSDSYEEIVILNSDLLAWLNVLTEKIGPPLITRKEYGIKIASEDVRKSQLDLALESAKQYGGISQGQTLYYGVTDSVVILILIWPWQNNVNVTLKKAIL